MENFKEYNFEFNNFFHSYKKRKDFPFLMTMLLYKNWSWRPKIEMYQNK